MTSGDLPESVWRDSSRGGVIRELDSSRVAVLSGALFRIDKCPVRLASFTLVDPLRCGGDALRGVLLDASAVPVALDLGVVAAFVVWVLAAGPAALDRMKVWRRAN